MSWWLKRMNDNLAILRRRAAHCRRLASTLFDQRVARELFALADDLDAEAAKLEPQTLELRHRDHAA